MGWPNTVWLTESDIPASYLDIWLNIDSINRLKTTLYDKRDAFKFAIVNFPFSKIPMSYACGVHTPQLIRYAKACSAYEKFSKLGQLLTMKLMLQGYNESRLKSFHKFTVAIMTLFTITNYHLSICWRICFPLFVIRSFYSSFGDG
jgi:hypothetical protein